MLRGNRLLVAALAVVGVTTMGIGWFTRPVQPHLTVYREADPTNTNYRPGGSECEPKSLASVTDRISRLRKADDCAQEAESYRQQSADLVQQTRAADAAQAQTEIASQQLWTGWLQTLGGFLTLAAAVGAAIYARDAAKESRKQANIAEQSYRAFVAVEGGQLLVTHVGGDLVALRDRKVTVMIGVVNVGRNPCVVDQVEFGVGPSPAMPGKFDRLIAGPTKVVRPDAKALLLEESMFVDDLPRYICGRVHFRDAVNSLRTSEFALRVSATASLGSDMAITSLNVEAVAPA